SSLDQIGVFGRTVNDAALGLEVIAGLDPLDSTSAAEPVPAYRDASRGSLTGVVIGRPREYFPPELDPEIRERCDAALDTLRPLPATRAPPRSAASAPSSALSLCRTRAWGSPCTTSSRPRKPHPISLASMAFDTDFASREMVCKPCTKRRARADSAAK